MQNAFELVQHERCEGFAFDVFGDQHERNLLLADLLEQWDQLLDAADFLFVNQDVRVLEFAGDAVLVVDEVRRQEPTVELHPLHDDDFGVGGLAFFDGDDAVRADELHRVGELLADFAIVVRGDARDFGDFLGILRVDRFGELVQLIDDFLDAELDAANDGHRVATTRDRLQTFAENELGEDRGGRGAVAGDIVRFAGGFLHELRAHVLERVLQLDILGDGDAVLGHGRAAPTFVEDRITATWPERRTHGAGQLAGTGKEFLTGVIGEGELLGGHTASLL